MVETIVNISTFSLIVAGIIALLRFKHLDRVYYPFAILLWIGSVNELLSFILVRTGHTTLLNNDVYAVAELLTLIWFFFRLGLFSRRRLLMKSIIAFSALFWVVETFVIWKGSQHANYFHVLSSFIIVLMSIHQMNALVIEETGLLLRNPLFWILLGYILYFTPNIIIECFWLYGLLNDKPFLVQIIFVMVCINLLCNLIFMLSVLWLPRKQPSLLLS